MRSFGVKSISQVHFICCKLSHVNIEVNNLGDYRRWPEVAGAYHRLMAVIPSESEEVAVR
jgi:hypothetical protein